MKKVAFSTDLILKNHLKAWRKVGLKKRWIARLCVIARWFMGAHLALGTTDGLERIVFIYKFNIYTMGRGFSKL